MLSEDELARVVAAIPRLGLATVSQRQALRDAAFVARIPAGRDVFDQGDRVDAIPLLLTGTVRVYQVGETGREVTLYRFRPGESCVLTANAILTGQAFPAIAAVEEEAEAVMVPAATFREWVGQDPLWRGFFVDLVAQRLASVMAVVDEVAFKRLDVKVAALIARRAHDANPVRITHQEIASELGSAREAVSRVLEDLAARGLVRPGRGVVAVTDLAGLEALSGLVT